jgi:DNA-binding transcriptional ArsR family regulator
MVNHARQLDDVFYALSDPTRRAILDRLSSGEATVKELAAPFEMSLPAVSKHLKALESAGLLAREVDGRVHRISLRPEGLRSASEWVERYRKFWGVQLDRLSAFLEVATERERASKEGDGR